MLTFPPVKSLFAACAVAFCIACAVGENDDSGEPAPRGLARGGSSGSGFGGTSPISRGGSTTGGSNGSGGSSGFGGSTGGKSGFGGVGGASGASGAVGSSGSVGVGGSLGMGGGLFGGAGGVAGSSGTSGSAGAPDRTPSPNNPKECPPMAPDNPIGPCVGLPVYLMCSYGTYNCICDWVHWICLG